MNAPNIKDFDPFWNWLTQEVVPFSRIIGETHDAGLYLDITWKLSNPIDSHVSAVDFLMGKADFRNDASQHSRMMWNKKQKEITNQAILLAPCLFPRFETQPPSKRFHFATMQVSPNSCSLKAFNSGSAKGQDVEILDIFSLQDDTKCSFFYRVQTAFLTMSDETA